MTFRTLLAALAAPLALASAAQAQTTTPAVVAGLPVGPTIEIRGVGLLAFGDLLQWRLVSEPPPELRKGDGLKMGGVVLASADGKTKYRLPVGQGFSSAENGNACKIERLGAYALIRCDRDFVFNTATGAPPIPVWPQFSDRTGSSKNPDYVEGLPLPWWKPTGLGIKGTTYVVLSYGSTNYGQMVETTEIPLGPALLDLSTGVIALARTAPQASAPLYDASAEAQTRPVATPMEGDGMTGRTLAGGRTIVTVSTSFDRCDDQTGCRGEKEPRFRVKRPLSYVFEARP